MPQSCIICKEGDTVSDGERDAQFLGGLLRQGPFSQGRGGSLNTLSFNILTLSNQWVKTYNTGNVFIIILLPSRATEIQKFSI